MRKQAIYSQENHLWMEIKESHLNESELSSSMPSNDGAKIRISGAIHDNRRLYVIQKIINLMTKNILL